MSFEEFSAGTAFPPGSFATARLMVCFCSQRPPLGASQRSSRNDYMKSGLYSTFTIQSLQVSPNSQPVKTELLLQQDPAPKVARTPKEVRTGGRGPRPAHQCLTGSRHLLQACVSAESKPPPPPPAGAGVDSSRQVIVGRPPSPCPTPALSPQVPADTARRSQVRRRPPPRPPSTSSTHTRCPA